MVSLARQRLVRLAQVLVPCCTLACFCQTPPQPPPSDTCDAPTTGTVDALEIAATRLNAEGFATGRADDVRPPRALADGDRVWLVQGGQGSEMVALRLVLRGPDVPTCISQATTATVVSALVGQNKDNLSTYPLDDGSRATKTFWIPGSYRTEAALEATAVGLKSPVTVKTLGTDGCATAGGCPCAQALGCACEEGLSDAGLGLFKQWAQCVKDACDAGPGTTPSACEQIARADGGRCAVNLQACAADGF